MHWQSVAGLHPQIGSTGSHIVLQSFTRKQRVESPEGNELVLLFLPILKKILGTWLSRVLDVWVEAGHLI